MGRTVITLAKKKLIKEQWREKEREIQKAKLKEISEQIESFKELDVESKRWIIAGILLASRNFVGALVDAIIFWCVSLCGKTKTEVRSGNEIIDQKGCTKEVERVKSKKIKVRPKKRKKPNEVAERNEDQPAEIIDGEKDEEVANEHSSPVIATPNPMEIHMEQDDVSNPVCSLIINSKLNVSSIVTHFQRKYTRI